MLQRQLQKEVVRMTWSTHVKGAEVHTRSPQLCTELLSVKGFCL